MAWIPNQLVQNWFTGLTSDGTDITLPITAMPQLEAAEVDSVTGDIRKFLFAFMERAWTKWNSLAIADRCTKMVLSKTSSIDSTTGVVTITYTYVFKNKITSQDVDSEV